MNNPPKEIWIGEGPGAFKYWSDKKEPHTSCGPYVPQPKPLLKWKRLFSDKLGTIILEAKHKEKTFTIYKSSSFGGYSLEVGMHLIFGFKTQRTAKQVAELIAGEL